MNTRKDHLRDLEFFFTIIQENMPPSESDTDNDEDELLEFMLDKGRNLRNFAIFINFSTGINKFPKIKMI